jgi:hypothetical protein
MDRQPLQAHQIITEGQTFEDYVAERRAYAEQLVNKWMWLIEGTKKQALKPIAPKLWEPLAMMFENQAGQFQHSLAEATQTTDLILPNKYALPIIRNIFPELIATKVAAVQPMPLQSGGTAKIFYLDFLREDAGSTNTKVLDSDYALNVENGVPKRIKMTMSQDSLTAIKDILAATWSTESMEDARGALGIDVEQELVAEMSREIITEIDDRILGEMLLWATAGNVNWNWTNSGTHTDKEHYETLGHALISAEDLIYANRYRKADWIIAGRNVVKYLRMMQDFKPEPRVQGENFRMGVELVGRIEGFWDIYVTPTFPTNRAIMGYYPRSQVDTGYIYAPYIPLAPMPLVYADFRPYNDATLPGAYYNTDKWTRNVRTRYGKKLVVPSAYATLSISA